MSFEITCRCGFYSVVLDAESRVTAEVAADRHESTRDAVLRPYRHATAIEVIEEVR